MKHLPIIIISLLIAGCSFVQFGGSESSKVKDLPPKPGHQQPEMRIAKQQATDVVLQLAKQADSHGIIARSTASGTLLDTALMLQIVEGIPVDRISWQDADKVQDLIEDIREMEREYREKVQEWEELMQEISENESQLLEMHKTNGTLWNWIIGLGVCLVLLVIICPSVGVPLVFKIVNNLRKAAGIAAEKAMEIGEDQMGQVVAAIEETKQKMKDHPEVYNHMMANLKKHTDRSTRDTIDKVKNKLHK